MNKAVAIVGPTGSGKTALALTLAKKFNGVLISADSRQVYRGLDVGTNKEGVADQWKTQPARVQAGIPQLLIDVARPGERFTLNDWLEQARQSLERIWSVGKLPIIVGGTGLYATALLEGYQPGGGRFAKVSQPISFEYLILQNEVDRSTLYQRSDERFAQIFDEVVIETKQLLDQGVSEEWLEKIGLDYRFAIRYLGHQLSRDEAVLQNQTASRHYIRRQLTWWRHHQQPQLVKTTQQAAEAVSSFLKVN